LDNFDNKSFESAEEQTEGKTGLVFDFSEEGFVFESVADISPKAEEAPVKEVENNETVEEIEEEEQKAEKESKEEFTLPESFTVSSGFWDSIPASEEEPVRVRATYVPRFTEASENYRMVDDPRNKAAKPQEVKVVAKPKEEIENVAPKDPTSELDEEKTVEKIVVAPGNITASEPTDESISIFKFDAETKPTEEKNEEQEQDVSSIVASLAKEALLKEEKKPEEQPAQQPEEDEPLEDKGIPDPEVRVKVIDYYRDSEIDVREAPEGASDATVAPKKKGSFEFTTTIQRDTVKDRFLDMLMSVRVRLIAAILVFVLVATVQCLQAFGVDLMKLIGLGGMFSAYAVIDLQFCVCLSLIALPEIIGSVKALLSKKLVPELAIPIQLLVLIGYTVIIAVTETLEYPVFGVVFGTQVLAAILATYVKRKAEFISFKVICKPTVKNVIDKKMTRELERENQALDGAVDEYNSSTARMFRTSFISDFFARSAKISENSFGNLLLLLVSFGVALVTGLASLLISDYSVSVMAQGFTLVFTLACPSFAILSHKLPFYRANVEASADKSTFVGESSIYSYSDLDVITYEDTEIFGEEDVSIRKIHLYGKAFNAPKAMKQMFALFAGQGGPLDRVFTAALDRKCAPAEELLIETDGISGVLDGDKICAGTEEYMRRKGILIPAEDFRTSSNATDSTQIMYGAENGEVYVKFYIRYSFSEEFTMLLPILKEQKIIPLIYTRDPNITDSLVRVLTMGEDIIRVMKKTSNKKTEEKIYRRISAGAVTLGDKSSAVNMILLAKRYSAFHAGLSVTELVSAIVGAAMAALLSVGGMLTVPTVALAIWQIAWCVFLGCISFRLFGAKRNKPESDEDYD